MPEPETEQPAAKCTAWMRQHHSCQRGRYDDEDSRCIFHSGKPDKDIAAFWRGIKAMLDCKDYDFSGFVFPNGSRFLDMVCDRPAYFHHTWFLGAACFDDTTFRGEADFEGATFQSLARFRRVTFQGEARFEGRADNRMFSSDADADFTLARFSQPEGAVFQHVFLGRARFLGAAVRKVDFTDVEWARRSLWGLRWKGFVERDDCLGRVIRWLCERWPARLKPRGRFAVWDELAPEDRGEEKDYALIGKLYRQLKHNYEEQRDPITAGDFHFGEMHMRRLSNPPRNWLLRVMKRNVCFLALYRWISGYGEDYLLTLAWIVGSIFLFALAFAYAPVLALQVPSTSGDAQPVSGFWQHVLYSVMCFLLRGDKPFEPVHLAGHYVSVAEGIMGPPLIALFVLALNRRFKR